MGLSITVQQADVLPLDVLSGICGGGVRKAKTGYWSWQSSQHAASVLRALLPYLVAKRSEAEVALRFQERHRRGARPDRALDTHDREELMRMKRDKRAAA